MRCGFLVCGIPGTNCKTPPIAMSRGVRQGASTSPAVWAITLDYVLRPLLSAWRDSFFGFPLRTLK
eukprot:8474286-Alexandrium_andersonii.AAC.1